MDDLTAEADYPRQITACRICGTGLILIFGASALGQAYRIPKYVQIMDSMVEGGHDALPPITKFLIQNQLPLMGAIALLMMGSTWGLWMSRRLSAMIYLCGASVALLWIFTLLIGHSMQQALIPVIVKFRG
jgi:hypothetical protein